LFDGAGFFSERWLSSLLGTGLVGDEDKDASLTNAVELDGFVISGGGLNYCSWWEWE